ncbi:MAG: glutathione peroxidase [Gammaproteobacteria bacterium]
MQADIYTFEVKTIDGKIMNLSEYKNNAILIVNVASKCGFTKQYAGLEALYQKYKSQNFVILGFPCNQFGRQEPGTEVEIKAFCELNYQVSFPLFSKIEVNGKNAHPLYQYLKTQAKGILGSAAIKWNFTKFLVNKEGAVLKRFAPADTPEEIESEIQGLL